VQTESTKVVQRVYDAYGRRDNTTPFELYTEDVVWDISELGHFGVARVYHGHDGVRACFRDLLSAFADFEISAQELRGYGDRVLATVCEHAVGRASGAVVDRRHHAVWSLREGKIAHMRVYVDRSDAERAVEQERPSISTDTAGGNVDTEAGG
jgi:ketosteroid isomerase-like protein